MQNQLKIRFFMHVPFEGPAAISDWIRKKGHSQEYSRFYINDPLPDASEVDMLVIMGGTMNVSDYHIHSWMQDEIQWIEKFIRTGKPVLGICLGAQIIAAALGAEVFPGKDQEIGWYNLQFQPSVGEFMMWKKHPGTRKVFQWHGDTFSIPEGATRIAGSPAFPNQGFIFEKQVIALQFHLEATPESVGELLENCRDSIIPGNYVQSEKEILGETRYFASNQELMFQLLDYLESQVLSQHQ